MKLNAHGVGESLFGENLNALLKSGDLLLKDGVAAVEIVVDVVEVEVGRDVVSAFVDSRRHASRRREVDMPAVRVVVEQQHAAYRREKGEDKPFAVPDEECKELAHSGLG